MESSIKSGLGYQERSLFQQGYDYNPEALKQLTLGLRFTPVVCMGIAVIGLYLEQPLIHFSLAALGIIPFWFPSGHPIDLFYNHMVRPLWNGVLLPPAPFPRRVACLAGGFMNLTIGIFFYTGLRGWAFGFGAVLITLQLVVIFTHFCLASWLYEYGMKFMGLWSDPVSPEALRSALAANAMIVDVRGPEEFAKGHIENAINIPAEQLEERLQDKTRGYILYCQGGVRSQMATRKLQASGFDPVFNLGAMERGRYWLNHLKAS